MAIRVLLCGVLVVTLGVEAVSAREWVSRDGRFTVEAELLSVDAGQVVLRREGGAVVRVPLERLSLGDVKYVQEAMQAAGMASPTPAVPPTKSPSTSEAVPPQSPPRTSGAPTKQTTDGGPPLAQPGLARWQAAPDPPSQGYGLKPNAKVDISVPVRYSRPFVLFSSAPSAFVLLGSEENRGVRQLWDLAKEQTVGEIDVEIGANDKLALSQDGQYLAYHTYRTRGEIRVWSFSAGKVTQTLKLPVEHSTIMFLAFASPQRLIVGESSESNYLVFDVQTGRQCGIVQAKPTHSKDSQQMSPGGNYLVVHSGSLRPMAIYDTRNGVCAGNFKTEIKSFSGPQCLSFSPDGKEFVAVFREGMGIVIQVWNMADGSTALTHRFEEDPVRKLGNVRYHGSLLQWLADRSGWLLAGVAVIDRESGKIIWQDREAIQANDVLPRRVVDTDRMLSFRKGTNEQTLHLVAIPKDEIAKSREVVAAGGTAADSGLPSLTQVDMQGVEDIALTHAAWDYRPSVSNLPPKAVLRKRLRLGNGAFDDGRTFFSRPDAARVAIGRTVKDGEAMWKASGFPLPQACDLYDLQSGEQLVQFNIPFPAEFIDLCPDGKLGLFRIDQTKDRLDIWDLESSRHVLGFRPFDEAGSRDRQIEWAGFVDKDHVIAVSKAGRIVAWKLPECKAVYRSQQGACRAAGRTRDRRTMVFMSGNTPHFVDALTGKLIGTLPDIQAEQSVINPRASFSADENRLAVLSACDEGCLLVAWDLTDGSLLMRSELPFQIFGLTWCGSDYVLLNRSAGSDDPDTLIDVARGVAVWNYDTVSGSALRSSPDQRGWFYCRSRLTAPGELVAAELPGDEVRSLLSRVHTPAPLIGPGATVTVQTQIDNPPQAIPPGWPELENLDQGLYQHFSKQLQDKRANVVARGNVRLVVGIKQEKMEETVSVGRLLGPSSKFLVTATLLIPYVAVLDSSGNRIWSKTPSERDIDRIDLSDCPEGMAKETFMDFKQWENAAGWLRSVEIPYPLFHPNVHRGFGDSSITPEGTKIRRSPSPAQMKAPNKTAGILLRAARG